MRGIDISHYNGWPFDSVTAEGYDQSDFVIVKATQGQRYKYVAYFEPAIKKALADGKLAGAYHYAAGKAPEIEADYFLSVVQPYLGKIILALDWEEAQNSAYGSTTWCKRFIDYVKDKTGITCLLYTGFDEIQTNQVTNLVDYVPLWIAGYPKDENSWVIPKWPSRYDISPWKQYSIWQFTSGHDALDRDYCPGTRAQWEEWCKGSNGTEKPAGKPQTDAQRYTGEYPELPSRGYYTIGDGYRQLPGMQAEIKKLQDLVNWIIDGNLVVDGKYGNLTAEAVEKAQVVLEVTPDGLFGSKTLLAAKSYAK